MPSQTYLILPFLLQQIIFAYQKDTDPNMVCINLKRSIKSISEILPEYNYPKKPLFYFAFQEPTMSWADFHNFNHIRLLLQNDNCAQKDLNLIKQLLLEFGDPKCSVKASEVVDLLFKLYTLNLWNNPRDIMLSVWKEYPLKRRNKLIKLFIVTILDCEEDFNERIIGDYNNDAKPLQLFNEIFDLFDMLKSLREKRELKSKVTEFNKSFYLTFNSKKRFFQKLFFAKMFSEISAFQNWDYLSQVAKNFVQTAHEFLEKYQVNQNKSVFCSKLSHFFRNYYNYVWARLQLIFAPSEENKNLWGDKASKNQSVRFLFNGTGPQYNIFETMNEDLKCLKIYKLVK